MRLVISGSTRPILTKFSGWQTMKWLDNALIHFAITQGTLPRQPIIGKIGQIG